MPWTKKDVPRFTKKAVTDALKALWVRIANAALAAGDIEATAIKKANAAVVKAVSGNRAFCTLEARRVENMSALVREDVYRGEEYWIVPTILMAEGVHNNLLYTADTFASWVGSWNGEPVTVQHPKGPGGEGVSANSPEVLEQCQIGYMFDVRVENNKLKGDAWINKAWAAEKSPELVAMINAGEMIEVSTGVFIETDGEPGEWNGETYEATVIGQSPDHLAFLPGGKGACSVEDGGGAPRINEGGKGGDMNRKEREGFWSRLRGLFTANEPSHDDVRSMIRKVLVDKAYPNGVADGVEAQLPYVVDVYDKHVIYEGPGENGYILFKQGYSVAADESVELIGEPMQVRMKREYVPVGNDAEPENQAPDAGAKAGGADMKRKQRVDALIADNASRWGEESRDFLMGLGDEVFESITEEREAPSLQDLLKGDPAGNEDEAVARARAAFKGEKPADNAGEQGGKQDEGKPIDLNAAIEAHPELKRAVNRERQYQANLVTQLKENTACQFSEDELKAMPVEMLEKLAKSLSVEADYAGRSTGRAENENDDDGIPAPPTLNFDETQED